MQSKSPKLSRQPEGLTYIVPPDEIMSDGEITRDFVTLQELQFSNVRQCVEWLARRKLIHNVFKCVSCDILMTLCKSRDRSDGLQWRCKECRKAATVRTGSIFVRSRIPLDTLLRLIYGWTTDIPQTLLYREIGLRSSNTVVDWCLFCRRVCERYLIENPVRIGGLNSDNTAKIVEIQEMNLCTNKRGKGEHWVIGGVERSSEECFLAELRDRSMNTLIHTIKQFILPGSVIVSDGMNAYSNKESIINFGKMYDHRVVHGKTCEESDDASLHLRNVENMLMGVQKKFRQHFGTSRSLFSSHLSEFIWRSRLKNADAFTEFVICVRKQYIC